MSLAEISTVDGVIDALGGTGETARITDRSDQAVSNWRAQKRLPANTFPIIKNKLKKLGFRAPLSLWGIKNV